MKVSVIIPVFNESDTLPDILERVRKCGIDLFQTIVVDDASTDGSSRLLKEHTSNSQGDGRIDVFHHLENRGKGAAVATGLAHTLGDIVVIQDADLEYDPADLPELLQPILDGIADVVYGSRFVGKKEQQVAYRRQRYGNWFLTTFSNLATGLKLTDMECGYKAIRRELLDGVTIEEAGFGFEPEITAKLARQKPRFREVSVSYQARTFNEGKKIRWLDGIRAAYAIVKYNFFR